MRLREVPVEYQQDLSASPRQGGDIFENVAPFLPLLYIE